MHTVRIFCIPRLDEPSKLSLNSSTNFSLSARTTLKVSDDVRLKMPLHRKSVLPALVRTACLRFAQCCGECRTSPREHHESCRVTQATMQDFRYSRRAQ